MMVENAERFGLATLHQIRGRVGRSDLQSYCIFMESAEKKKQNERLAILNRSNDGFEIANADLKLRGPGGILWAFSRAVHLLSALRMSIRTVPF